MLEKPSPLDPALVADLVTRWQRDHDERARDELCRRFRPVIKASARRWGSRYRIHPDDADQETALAFLRSIDKFDPAMGSLETYFRIWARAMVGRARLAELPMKVGSHALNDMSKATRTNQMLRQQLGRWATMEEIAAETGLTVSRVENALAARSLNTRTVSMDTPITGDDSLTIGDILAADDDARPDMAVEGANTVAAVCAAIDAVLDGFVPRHREVVHLRLMQGLTLEDAGERMGITKERVRQIEAKAIPRLREALRDNPAVLALLGREPAPEEVDDVDGPLLNAKDVRARTGLNPDELTEMVSRGAFPRPVTRDRRGQRLWRESAVARWLR